MKNRIKGKIISRWRLFQIRWGWHYNHRFMAYLIENYSGHVISQELILKAQGEHIRNETLRDDLIILDEKVETKTQLN